MPKKPVNSNARAALDQMKLEISNELGMPIKSVDGSNLSASENGKIGGRVGGQMSKKLVEMGQAALLKQYSDKK